MSLDILGTHASGECVICSLVCHCLPVYLLPRHPRSSYLCFMQYPSPAEAEVTASA